MAGAATDVLYPVQIIKVQGDTVFLSQGQGRLEQDASMQVYRPAGEMKDPDTGLTIKLEGNALATLTVTDVRPDYGVARLDGPASSPLQAGDRVRSAAGADSPTAGPAGQAPSPGSSEAPIQW